MSNTSLKMLTVGHNLQVISNVTKLDFEIDNYPHLSLEKLLQKIARYHIIICRSTVKIPAKVIHKGIILKAIGTASVGKDHIDQDAAKSRELPVFNAPEGNVYSTGELTLGYVLSGARNIIPNHLGIHDGRWRFKQIGTEIRGKVAGVIGTGRTGSYVIRLLSSLGMKVKAYSPNFSDKKAQLLNCKKSSLEEIYRTSDFISIHVPLNSATRGLINQDAFRKMKDSVYIINMARGGVINEFDLINALYSGEISGAALDTFREEPLSLRSPLLDPRLSSKLILGPHSGGMTDIALKQSAIEVTRKIEDYLIKNGIFSERNKKSVFA